METDYCCTKQPFLLILNRNWVSGRISGDKYHIHHSTFTPLQVKCKSYIISIQNLVPKIGMINSFFLIFELRLLKFELRLRSGTSVAVNRLCALFLPTSRSTTHVARDCACLPAQLCTSESVCADCAGVFLTRQPWDQHFAVSLAVFSVELETAKLDETWKTTTRKTRVRPNQPACGMRNSMPWEADHLTWRCLTPRVIKPHLHWRLQSQSEKKINRKLTYNQIYL